MNMKELQNTLEAILFAVGEPVELQKLSQILETDELLLSQVIENLRALYDERDGGLCILKLDDKYQLCTQKQYADAVRRVLESKRNTPLSQAAFEVLAIIAYNQPVTRAYIDEVRGVDSTYSVSSLIQKGLLKVKGHLDVPGRPALLVTTEEFLRCFGLSSISDLPAKDTFVCAQENVPLQISIAT